jgi:molecular chaperone DnaK
MVPPPMPIAPMPIAPVAATVAAAAFAPPTFSPASPSAPTMYGQQAPVPGFDIEPSSAASTAKGFTPAPALTARQPVAQVLDVTPRGLGIATVAGYCEELIRRNSRLPAEMVKMFTTSRDKQDTVRIVVCQGESRRLDNNVVIGDLTLGNLPLRPRGETSIEVTFQLDASGILKVRARDAKTGKEQEASLDTVGNLTEQEVSVSRDRLQALPRAR